MKHSGTPFHNYNFYRTLMLLVLCLPLFTRSARAQQDYIGRYDLYTGFSNMYTPSLNGLNQMGFHLQTGVSLKTWLSGGFDYSVQSGTTNLTASMATKQLQQELGTELAAIDPAYVVDIPLDTNTQAFTAGTQFVYRHYKHISFFVRPSLSAFRIAATPKPTDAIGTAIAAQIVPSGRKLDWVGAYGFGGGIELKATRHAGLRIQYDGVFNHPYNDILANGNWTNRISVGPAFHFGRNIVKPKNTAQAMSH